MGLFRSGVADVLRSHLSEQRAIVESAEMKVERIEEALTSGVGMAALRREDLWGWSTFGAQQGEELSLDDVKTHATEARALLAANTLVKRGVLVRNAYIWSQPIKYPDAAQPLMDDTVNQENFFSDEAQIMLEQALITDGQYFLLLDDIAKQIRVLPMSEITGTVTNAVFQNEVWFYRWTYSETVQDSSGNSTTVNHDVYIPHINYTGKPMSKIGDVPVDMTKRIEHNKVNSQVGWRWGIPDVLGAVFWARAYKEYLEAQHTLAKSLAKIAFKVTSQSGKGQKQVAAKMATPTTTGQMGGTAALGLGQDLVALNKSGSGVDFGGGTPLAAMVAAALDIPLSVLLTDGSAGGRQGAENALEAPTLKTMDLRRKAHLASRARVLRYFGIMDEIKWQQNSDDPVHRFMQSLQLADTMGILHPDEVRQMTLIALNIVSDHAIDEIPEKYTKQMEKATALPSPGPLSDGTNDSRDNPGGPTDA